MRRGGPPIDAATVRRATGSRSRIAGRRRNMRASSLADKGDTSTRTNPGGGGGVGERLGIKGRPGGGAPMGAGAENRGGLAGGKKGTPAPPPNRGGGGGGGVAAGDQDPAGVSRADEGGEDVGEAGVVDSAPAEGEVLFEVVEHE